jgi:hypothetical protein
MIYTTLQKSIWAKVKREIPFNGYNLFWHQTACRTREK